MSALHIHTPDDGRGVRWVFVNGKKVNRVVYADTSKGFVDVLRDPARLDKRKKRLLTRRIRGDVRIELVPETPE